jgi:hypothetical protein
MFLPREDRRRLKAEYAGIFSTVSGILRRHDPVGLVAIGAPPHEYEPEVGTILPRLREISSEEDACRITTEEFVKWFGDDTIHDAEALKRCGTDIWKHVVQIRAGGSSQR